MNKPLELAKYLQEQLQIIKNGIPESDTTIHTKLDNAIDAFRLYQEGIDPEEYDVEFDVIQIEDTQHVFTVPKDEEKFKQYTDAILNHDLSIQRGLHSFAEVFTSL